MTVNDLTALIRKALNVPAMLYQMEVAIGLRDGGLQDYKLPVKGKGISGTVVVDSPAGGDLLINQHDIPNLEKMIRTGKVESIFGFAGRFDGDYPLYVQFKNGKQIRIGKPYGRYPDAPAPIQKPKDAEGEKFLADEINKALYEKAITAPRLIYGKMPAWQPRKLNAGGLVQMTERTAPWPEDTPYTVQPTTVSTPIGMVRLPEGHQLDRVTELVMNAPELVVKPKSGKTEHFIKPLVKGGQTILATVSMNDKTMSTKPMTMERLKSLLEKGRILYPKESTGDYSALFESVGLEIEEAGTGEGDELVASTLSLSLAPVLDHGRTSHVVTGKGAEVKTAFVVVEAGSLIPSNTPDGRINTDYPQELQPRDRTRKSSVMQIMNMSKNLRPAQLTDSGLSSHGAPIIGPDLVVESGNGRTLSIIRAYSEGTAAQYREYLVENAALYGLNLDKVEKMREPVMVRVRLEDVDRAQFARDSNLSDLQGMAPTEVARVDAEQIDDKMMALFSPSEGGDLLAASNRAFVQAFLNKMGAEQAAGYLTADGRPTKQVVDRIQAAIFAKAYKSESLLRLAVEEPDPEIRNILTALNVAAPSFVQMGYLSGEAHKQAADTIGDSTVMNKNLDDTALSALVDATTAVREAKAAGQDVREYLSQQNLFGDTSPETATLAKFIADNNRSAKRMGTAFKALADEICEELIRQGSAACDMFGAEPLDLVSILARVSEKLTIGQTDNQASLFEGVVDLAKLAAARAAVNAAPTVAQQEAGNYGKGHLDYHGLDLAIENPMGSYRAGTDRDGKEWRTQMANDYGYIKGTEGADGDQVDVFIGDDHSSDQVFIINQVEPGTSQFDEHKAMFGFADEPAARAGYLANYEPGWKGLGSVAAMGVNTFKLWLKSGDMKRPA